MTARITMVKKRLASGEPCRKCAQAEDLLRQRGLWERIDEVAWADETDADSVGMQLAREHQVEVAPFFLVEDERGTELYTSVLKLVKERLSAQKSSAPAPTRPIAARQDASAAWHAATDGTQASATMGGAIDGVRAPATSAAAVATEERVQALARELATAEPEQMVRAALEWFGVDCAIAFSGAEDVALIEMATRTGLPFSCFCLDTGRLHPETYRFIDQVRQHYKITIEMVFPQFVLIENLVREKGLFSFYQDGHGECCGIRKVEPLKRRLAKSAAWITGQRKDQSPVTRSELEHVHWDTSTESGLQRLVKFNPLANWSSGQVWQYLREHEVPYNSLHQRGFVSIGCEPCTRAVRPGEHERAGRWWWEEATQRECGLHLDKPSFPAGARLS